MLRILLWRLGFEFWDWVAVLVSWVPFLARFSVLGAERIYFAFGANLSPAVLRQRQIVPGYQEDFLLRDHELLFNQPGPYEGFGFASVHSRPGKMVFGRLLRLRAIDEKRMDYFEVVPFLKRHRKVTATQDGHTFFFYQATFPKAGLRPTEEYLGKIMQAAEQSPIIPTAVLAELQAVEPLPMASLQLATRNNFLIHDYERGPAWMHRWWQRYDILCRRLLMWCYQLNGARRFIRLPPETDAIVK